MKSDKPRKPNEIPVPGKDPETIPSTEPEPGIWPRREPEIQPEREPLTVPPVAPPEIPGPPQSIELAHAPLPRGDTRVSFFSFFPSYLRTF